MGVPEYKFNYGKNKGLTISDPEVTTSYLEWVEREWDLTPSVREMFNFEIARRKSDASSIGRVTKLPRNK